MSDDGFSVAEDVPRGDADLVRAHLRHEWVNGLDSWQPRDGGELASINPHGNAIVGPLHAVKYAGFHLGQRCQQCLLCPLDLRKLALGALACDAWGCALLCFGIDYGGRRVV